MRGRRGAKDVWRWCFDLLLPFLNRFTLLGACLVAFSLANEGVLGWMPLFDGRIYIWLKL